MDHRSSKKLRLAIENAHPIDERIQFQEEGHVYFFDGKPIGISVTGFLAQASGEHFDADAVLARMKTGRNWPNPKYSDVGDTDGRLVPWTDEKIKKSWDDKRDTSAALGTDVHGKMELFLNDEPVVFDDASTNSVEFSYLKAWYESMQREGWTAYRTEWVIVDPAADLAGSIDCVLRHSDTDSYMIVDWKRCLTKSNAGFSCSFGKRFAPPIDDLQQTGSNKWALQVNVYREILEDVYGLKIADMCMVVCHPELPAAEVHRYPRLPHAAKLIQARKLEVCLRQSS